LTIGILENGSCFLSTDGSTLPNSARRSRKHCSGWGGHGRSEFQEREGTTTSNLTDSSLVLTTYISPSFSSSSSSSSFPILRIQIRLIIITTVVLRNRETLSATISLPQLLPLRPFLPINPRNLLTNPPDSPAVPQRHHLAPGAEATRCGLFHDDVEFLPINQLLRACRFPGRLPVFEAEGLVPEPRLFAKQ
jgi:hypothetical protein